MGHVVGSLTGSQIVLQTGQHSGVNAAAWNLEVERVLPQLKVTIRTENKVHAHLNIAFIRWFCSIMLNQDHIWLHCGQINPDLWTVFPGFLKDFSAWKLFLMAFKTEYQLMSCFQANTVVTVLLKWKFMKMFLCHFFCVYLNHSRSELDPDRLLPVLMLFADIFNCLSTFLCSCF